MVEKGQRLILDIGIRCRRVLQSVQLGRKVRYKSRELVGRYEIVLLEMKVEFLIDGWEDEGVVWLEKVVLRIWWRLWVF